MPNHEELLRKYELVTSNEYKEIRQEALNFIVNCGNSTIGSERIQGMLLLVGHIDSWKDDYEQELEKRKEN